MSRPIAYNASGPLSGSIRGGSVNYTVDSGNRDYTTFASKKWVPSADGVAPIVFVTDTYTQGFELNPSLAVPLFFSCNGTGSAAILYTANRIPGSPGNYSDANVALNDLINARGYFILESNDPFEGIDADGLALDLDAAKMSSYPQVGTNWRDLSGNGNTGALTNGPTWNSNGWFDFDGIDDYGLASRTPSISPTSGITQEALVNFDADSAVIIGLQYGASSDNSYAFWRDGANWNGLVKTSSGTQVIQYNQVLTTGRWIHFLHTYSGSTQYLYVNGTQVASSGVSGGDIIYDSNNNVVVIGGDFNSGYNAGLALPLNGKLAKVGIYSKGLSQTEINQNYFGSPIVTDGLVFAVDANNIVSYPKSGTAWYNLTGSVGTGTLTNGPTFNINNGGSIRFDGVDDFVNIPYNSSLDIPTAITVEVWVKYASQGEIGSGGRTYSVLSYKGYPWTWLLEDISGQFNFRISTTSDGDSRLDSNYYHGVERWDHVACTYNGSTQSIYVNGILQNSKSLTGTIITSGTTIELGTYGTGDYSFNGWLANHRVYNRALSAAEVQQNYQAEQYRFETPAGPATNGLLLYWDAGNLDSYPGTGTTIYDLSGNGNNGTLVNGVGYNQTNGGVLTFDGVDDGVYLTSLNLSSTNNTVMGAARYTGTTPHGRMISAYNNNWLIGCWNNSTENYYAQGWVSPVQNGANDTNWRIVTALGDVGADSYTSYINNTLSAGPNNGGSQGPDGIFISPSSEPSTGQFSFLLVYNRVLTAAEMTQNYNYFKGRFGL